MSEVGKPFKSIEAYNNSMRKSMKDKLFFLDFIPEEKCIFVDFGCADGSLLTAIYEMDIEGDFHNKYIGYDISSEMIDLAKTKFNYCTDKVLFTSNWKDVESKLKTWKGTKILILSSVIHEVYSYAKDRQEISDFWDKVINTNFDYICVRDMMYSQDMDRNTSPNLYNAFITWRTLEMKTQVDQFSSKYGSIQNNLNFVHFLLKYRWTINWDREVNENYFPIEVNAFLDNFEYKYNITYLQRFRIPFLEQCWEKDFNIKIDDYTHIKAIFERKK